jgi:hypothetical protein
MRVLRFAQEPGSDKGDGCDNSYNSKGKNKYRSSSPFDYAQGQDDGVKQTTTSAKATATATILPHSASLRVRMTTSVV